MKRSSSRRKSFRELQFGAMQQMNPGELALEPLPEPLVGADASPALYGQGIMQKASAQSAHHVCENRVVPRKNVFLPSLFTVVPAVNRGDLF